MGMGGGGWRWMLSGPPSPPLAAVQNAAEAKCLAAADGVLKVLSSSASPRCRHRTQAESGRRAALGAGTVLRIVLSTGGGRTG